MVIEIGVEANLMEEVVAEGPCTRLKGARIRNSSTINLLTSRVLKGLIVGHDTAYDMSWKDLMKMMTEAYCPRNEIQKLEGELWNLTVKCTDVVGYIQRFQELALLCLGMVHEEEDKVERYIWGLLDSIQGNVTSARTTRLQDTVKLANSLMDQKIRVFAARKANKKGWRTTQGTTMFNNHPTRGRMTTATYYKCGEQGHYKSNCLKLKNQNRENQTRNAGFENRPPMLNKKNYVPWSSRLLRYAKSRPNGKLIYNYIINGPYVSRMIPEPSDANSEVPVNETFHEQTDDELIEKELKQAKLFNKWESFTSTDGASIESYYHRFSKLMNDFKRNKHFPEKIAMFHQDQPSLSTYMQQPQPNNNYNPQPSFNQNYMQQPMPSPKDISDPTTAMNKALVLMAKVFKLNYSTPTNNNQRISSNPRNGQIAQLGMNMGQDRQMQMVRGNGGNQFRQYAGQNVRNQNGYNAVQNVGNQINPNRNGNVEAAWAKGNAIGNNCNQIRCYSYKGLGYFARIYIQASTSGTQTDKAPVYDSNGSAENDSNVISEVSSVEQDGGTVDQHPATAEETRAYFESLYNNLAIEVDKSSSAHQEIHKIVKDENFPIINQVDTRVQIFKIQFLKEASKFVQDFKSLAKEADESIVKQKALELEIKRLLRAVVRQDLMSVVQSNSVVDTSNLQTKLERIKERFENYIIKKENEYAKLWNDWYKKCEECKYDKISYDKAYNDMQQKIELLRAQLGDLKGKSKDTPYVSNSFDPLSHKIENESVELEFHVRNYEKENAHLKTAYKNMFDSINVSEQKDTTRGTSVNTKFAKQSILGKPPSSSRPKLYVVTPLPKFMVFPKVGTTHALSKPVTSNLVPTPTESEVVKNDNVISSRIFRTNPSKTSRVDNVVLNKLVKASVRLKPITLSKPHAITKNDQCLITVNHDVCMLNYVNGMNSRDKKQEANISNIVNQMKHKAQVGKPKNVGSKERLSSPKPSTPRSCVRWSPTGRMFDLKGKIITTSESVCQSDCFEGGQNWFDTLLIPLLSEYKPKNKEDHGDNECDT
uniref:Retrotransposon gag domain-containing protein n=1 Tax=Tanacetum cinerariifolium TaxID=118510 RepID=A0A6L2LPX2_TANCI|nr:hypothetical protein [Tanacetum cinerariifolium]